MQTAIKSASGQVFIFSSFFLSTNLGNCAPTPSEQMHHQRSSSSSSSSPTPFLHATHTRTQLGGCCWGTVLTHIASAESAKSVKKTVLLLPRNLLASLHPSICSGRGTKRWGGDKGKDTFFLLTDLGEERGKRRVFVCLRSGLTCTYAKGNLG